MTGTIKKVVLALVFTCLVADPAAATLLEPFSGYADVSAVQSEVNNQSQESVRQDYNLSFMHRIVPYVDMRLAYRYYDFNMDFVDLALGSYRKEKQPSAELRWNHPLFEASGSALRREVETLFNQPIITNSSQFVLESKDQNYPLVEFRYDQQHVYSTDVLAGGDVRNQRIQAGATYDPGVHRLGYTYSRELNDNVVSDLETRTQSHVFRWSGANRARSVGQLQLSGNYNFGYTETAAEVRSGGPILRVLPVLTGLYALDDTPDIGPLETRSGLADGNTSAPVIPLIDIGGSNVDHNLGADLGNVHDIGGVYVYTDRPSGTGVTWSVWGSIDNFTWTLIASAPQQLFNQALNRYELTLSTASAHRYVKVVNGSLNDIAQVYVTEISVLELVSEKDEDVLDYLTHQLDGRMAYRFNERWQSSLDASFLVNENPGRFGDRSRSALGARLNYEPSERFLHNLNWEVTHQANEDAPNIDAHSIGYTLVYDPLRTLRSSFGVNDRLGWIDRVRSNHLLSGAAEANADLIKDLLLSVGATAALAEDFVGNRRSRTWIVRSRLEAALTRSFDINLNAQYQESLETIQDELTTRLTAGVELDWRVTRDVYFRGAWRKTRGQSDTGFIDALLSWTILPSLRVSAQHYENLRMELTTTLRQSVNLNWELTPRSHVYLRLAKVDLSGGGGTRTTSFHQGFRIGF